MEIGVGAGIFNASSQSGNVFHRGVHGNCRSSIHPSRDQAEGAAKPCNHSESARDATVEIFTGACVDPASGHESRRCRAGRVVGHAVGARDERLNRSGISSHPG